MIRIYNTLGKALQNFESVEPGLVKMYVCGPTVYDSVHIGHGRTFVVFDIIARYFRFLGYNVIRIQNITDIDDKIIKRAQETGKDWSEIADFYTKEYLELINKLNVKIDLHPRVTTHIREIIQFIERLIEKGHAYVAPSGSVYFDVDSFPNYGELSNLKSKELWEQQEGVVKEKKNPYDFALWKAWKPGEPYWDSPWGKGRPGWHIECSTMSMRYLGEEFDIHGGGQDLIFPHHENEKAQSEALLGKRWVRYWVHSAFVTVGKDKMSKSLKNIVPLKDAINKWGVDVLRLWYFSSHYRSPLEYSEENLEQMRSSLNRLKDSLAIIRSIINEGPKHYSKDEEIKVQKEIIRIIKEFHDAMSNDFDTPRALSKVYELSSLVFTKLQYSRDFMGAMLAFDMFRSFSLISGVLEQEIYSEMDRLVKIIDAVIEIRNLLRSKKMYDLSDQIRSILTNAGIKVLDSGDKSYWRFE